MTRSCLLGFAFSALLTVSSPRLAAQAVYGSIVGTVTDASGAAVPSARITITDVGRESAIRRPPTNPGNFTQRYLIVGRYRVRVEAPGFKALVQENVTCRWTWAGVEMSLDPAA